MRNNRADAVHCALHDALTDCRTARCSWTGCGRPSGRALRYGYAVAVFFLDLDGFKTDQRLTRPPGAATSCSSRSCSRLSGRVAHGATRRRAARRRRVLGVDRRVDGRGARPCSSPSGCSTRCARRSISAALTRAGVDRRGHRSRSGRRPAARRGPRHVPGQVAGARPRGLLRRGHARGDGRECSARARAAAGAGGGRAVARVPADRGPGDRRVHRRGGALPLDVAAAGVHPVGRGDRADRAAGRVGAGGGVPDGRELAGRPGRDRERVQRAAALRRVRGDGRGGAGAEPVERGPVGAGADRERADDGLQAHRGAAAGAADARRAGRDRRLRDGSLVAADTSRRCRWTRSRSRSPSSTRWIPAVAS